MIYYSIEAVRYQYRSNPGGEGGGQETPVTTADVKIWNLYVLPIKNHNNFLAQTLQDF